MISSKTLILMAVLLVGCVVATYVSSKRDARARAQLQQTQATGQIAVTENPLTYAPALPETAPTSSPALKPRTSKPKPQPQSGVEPLANQQSDSAQSPQELAAQAQAALSLVGSSQEANAYWYAAVNNPGVPALERTVLIAALSEAGFEDRNNLTEDDLPLILSRIAILRRLAENPLDQANAAAIEAAYNELVDMAAEVTGE
jgi:hypothetical protein